MQRKIDKIGIDILLNNIPLDKGEALIKEIQANCPHVVCTVIGKVKVCDECEALIKLDEQKDGGH